MADRQNFKLAEIVGKNIVRLRREAGMTQEYLAEKLNITGAAMSRIENGLATPRFSRLEELASILGCHVIDLFKASTDPLKVHLDTLEDLLRPYPAETQEELVAMFANTLKVFGNNWRRMKQNKE